MPELHCHRCNKRLSRKSARLIDGKLLCSTCMFAPPEGTVVIPITADNLPKGPQWEEDGACWLAVRCNPQAMGCDWRWQPMNEKALGKEGPEGDMTDCHPGTFARLRDSGSRPEGEKP